MFKSPLRYACNGCGECCRVNQIPLTCLDLIRLIQGDHILENMVETEPVDALDTDDALYIDGAFVQFLLRYDREKNACSFLDAENRCTIHPQRPSACRTYPLETSPRGLLRIMPEAQDIHRDFCDKTPMPKGERKLYLQNQKLGDWESSRHQDFVDRWNRNTPKAKLTLSHFYQFIHTLNHLDQDG